MTSDLSYHPPPLTVRLDVLYRSNPGPNPGEVTQVREKRAGLLLRPPLRRPGARDVSIGRIIDLDREEIR
jgi:hypothetical protein